MTRKVTRFSMPVEVRYDGTLSTPEAAVEDFYRMLMEAEQAGLLDRTIIDITYGDPDAEGTETEDDEPDDDEEYDTGINTGSGTRAHSRWQNHGSCQAPNGTGWQQ